MRNSAPNEPSVKLYSQRMPNGAGVQMENMCTPGPGGVKAEVPTRGVDEHS